MSRLVPSVVFPLFDYVCVQAMRVTQEQRGALKLEAYVRLLQELLLIQLQQASITHPGTSQVSAYHASQHWHTHLDIIHVWLS